MSGANLEALALLGGLALSLPACGSSSEELPPEHYPSGPYGGEVGSVVQNLTFMGFRQPNATAMDEANLEQVALADFYDPSGKRGVELLLLNTAAIWCAACQAEHRTLPARTTEFSEQGLAVLSALFQDAEREPAQPTHLAAWVATFDCNYAMVLDPEYQAGIFGSAETAPLNLIIDARTMKIEQKFVGDQSAVIWPYVRDTLARRR